MCQLLENRPEIWLHETERFQPTIQYTPITKFNSIFDWNKIRIVGYQSIKLFITNQIAALYSLDLSSTH